MSQKQTAPLKDLVSKECLQEGPSSSRSPTPECPEDIVSERGNGTEFESASTLRPIPKIHFYGRFVMCNGRNCQGKNCTYAHSEEELRAWNAQRTARTKGSSPRERRAREADRHPTSPTGWSTFRQRVRQDLVIQDIEEELMSHNYKIKLHKLLCWEEKARTDILINRCDGEYTLVLHKDGFIPPLLSRGIRDYHMLFGFLENVAGDIIANATQASERVILTVRGRCSVTADILPENYSHTQNRLYLAFDEKSSQQLRKAMGTSGSIDIGVEFELTHRYFDSLHEALNSLPDGVVRKLMPAQEDDFSCPLRRLNKLATEYDELRMDDEQSQALKNALVYPSADPPVLILGPFGTGKTRVLAAAAYHILRENYASRQPTRVLICSHQASADLIIEQYYGVIKNDQTRPWQGAVIRLFPLFRKKTGSYPLLYKTIEEFTKLLHYECSKHIIVVTTYDTSPHLREAVPSGYFTHILLDEAAQVTEPEALCPLSMATSNTTIILAGDECQIRPPVVGEEALANDLGKSLLERLYERYKVIGPQAISHCSFLKTNYGCDDEILKLSSRLFYNDGLQPGIPQSPTHPLAPYPLIFVCSSLDPAPRCIMEDTDEQEASTLLQQLARFVDPWPEEWGEMDMATVGIIVSSRRQVATVKRHATQYRRLGLSKATIAPAYGMLGQQFRALLIGTSEPAWENGESRNPTKSTCDPHVFNTVLTRAQSLVVAIGNPLALIHMESYSLCKEKCWAEYIRECLAHDTIITIPQLEEEWHSKGKRLLMQQLHTMP